MPLNVKYTTLEEKKFEYPFRMFISGSSQSGKTHFSEQLLKNSVFQKNPTQVFYYHPDYLSTTPVNWHETMKIPVTYATGVPSISDLCKIDEFSCVVLDDLYEECVNEKSIDYLFRVLSGKKNVSVIIMSQRYFATGKFAMNIRNNCNYTVLMRNVDGKINSRISTLMGLQRPVNNAIKSVFPNNYWPYLFIDSTPRGQVSRYRVYTNIFGSYQTVYSDDGMKAVIVTEKDFLRHFKILTKNQAEPRNGSDKKQKKSDTGARVDFKKTLSEQRNRLAERARKIRHRRKIEKTLLRGQKLT